MSESFISPATPQVRERQIKRLENGTNLTPRNDQGWSEADHVGMFSFRQQDETLAQQFLDDFQRKGGRRRLIAQPQFQSGEQAKTTRFEFKVTISPRKGFELI